jgi:regulator of protease activity HflC (stomatin/prohibitin superfamily)
MLTSRHAAYALVAVAILLGLLLLSVGIANAQVIGLLADSIFDRLDSNHDGILSQEEARAARASMFDRIDSDRSGTATLAEIEAAKAKAQERRAKRLARLAELAPWPRPFPRPRRGVNGGVIRRRRSPCHQPLPPGGR